MALTGTVLVLRALGLGDALTAVPALRGLRRLHPRARLVLAAPAHLGRWQQSCGLVDDVLPTTGLHRALATRVRPDVAVNLHGRGPLSHRLLQQLQPGRLVAHDCPEAGHRGPAWPDGRHEIDRWCALVDSEGGRCDPTDLRLPSPLRAAPGGGVIVHPGAASPSRRWPPERWRDVVRHLAADGHRVTVTGTSSEAGLCARVAAAHPRAADACGLLDLDGLARAVAAADLVICGDTGIAHLATAFGTASIVLFGPVPPDEWGPRTDRDRHVVLWRPHPDDVPGDPHGEQLDPRLARIGVDDVLAAATALAVVSGRDPAFPRSASG